MEEVKSRGPYIYSVLESAQAFLSQHPFEELEEPTSESKGLWSPHSSFSYGPSGAGLWDWRGVAGVTQIALPLAVAHHLCLILW